MWSAWATIATLVYRQRLQNVVVPVVAPVVVAEVGHRPVFVANVRISQKWHSVCDRTVACSAQNRAAVILVATVACIREARWHVVRVDGLAFQQDTVFRGEPCNDEGWAFHPASGNISSVCGDEGLHCLGDCIVWGVPVAKHAKNQI